MTTRHPSTWLLATLAMVSLAGRASAGPTPAQVCQAAKNKAAGKYDGCRQKAEAGVATTGDNAKYDTALATCLTKYQATWPGLEAKAMAQGSACPSVGDQATIQGVIDQHTTSIAAALGGVPGGSPSDLLGQRLKTGQTTCANAGGTAIPCAGTGQDGELQKGLARAYTDNGNGTITDTKTGLMWEKLSDDGSIHDKDTFYGWTNAFATKIATLKSTRFAGFNDWRVPNVNELQSLVNYGAFVPAINAAFNTSCAVSCTVLTCSCTQSSDYWSSSTYQLSPTVAWFVNFGDGTVDRNVKSFPGFVRAVRGGS